MGANVNNDILSIDDLYEKHTTAENIKESFDRMTAPTGRYTFTATKVENLRGGEDHPLESLRGREYVHVWGKMTGIAQDGTEKKFGHIGFDASWERRTDKRQQPDGAYKRWGQLVRALGMEKDSIGEVSNAISQYPLSIYVTESFKTQDGNRVARDSESRKSYRAAGYTAKNYVDSISRS